MAKTDKRKAKEEAERRELIRMVVASFRRWREEARQLAAQREGDLVACDAAHIETSATRNGFPKSSRPRQGGFNGIDQICGIETHGT
jgi:hypothetical protein